MTKTLEVRGSLWTGSSLQPAESSITMSGDWGRVRHVETCLDMGLSQNQLGGNLLLAASIREQDQKVGAVRMKSRSSSFFTHRSSLFTWSEQCGEGNDSGEGDTNDE